MTNVGCLLLLLLLLCRSYLGMLRSFHSRGLVGCVLGVFAWMCFVRTVYSYQYLTFFPLLVSRPDAFSQAATRDLFVMYVWYSCLSRIVSQAAAFATAVAVVLHPARFWGLAGIAGEATPHPPHPSKRPPRRQRKHFLLPAPLPHSRYVTPVPRRKIEYPMLYLDRLMPAVHLRVDGKPTNIR